MVTALIRATRGSARSMTKASSRGYSAGLPGRHAPERQPRYPLMVSLTWIETQPVVVESATTEQRAEKGTRATSVLSALCPRLSAQSCTQTIVPSGAQPNIQEATGRGRLMQPCDIG